VVERDGNFLSVGFVDNQSDLLSRRQLVQLNERDKVSWIDFVVVRRVGESERKNSLFLEICLVDSRERFDDDGNSTQIARFESSMFSAASFSIVFVSYDNPVDFVLLVVSGHVGNCTKLFGEIVVDAVGFSVLRIDSSDQKVVGDVVQMTSVFEPWTGHRDVVGGTFAFGLNEDRNLDIIFSIPRIERLQRLKSVTLRINLDLHFASVCRRLLESIFSSIESS